MIASRKDRMLLSQSMIYFKKKQLPVACAIIFPMCTLFLWRTNHFN